jgi:hypothetical protein
MSTILWPVGVLRPRNVSFDIYPRTLAGPTSVSGKTQTVSSDAGIWRITFGDITVRNRAEVLAWRGIDAILEGRLNPILVPFCRAYQPVPDGAVAAGLYDDVPHDDDSPFDDETEYGATVIEVETSASASSGATSMAVTIGYADTIVPGQVFSIGERAYRVRTITYASATAATITFRPPLREAVASAAELNFDNPVCRMRLASDSEMALPLSGRRRATETVNFVEDV